MLNKTSKHTLHPWQGGGAVHNPLSKGTFVRLPRGKPSLPCWVSLNLYQLYSWHNSRKANPRKRIWILLLCQFQSTFLSTLISTPFLLLPCAILYQPTVPPAGQPGCLKWQLPFKTAIKKPVLSECQFQQSEGPLGLGHMSDTTRHQSVWNTSVTVSQGGLILKKGPFIAL